MKKKTIITILTLGTRGDVQPFVALGYGLLQSGYHVKIAAHEEFKSLIENFGLEFSLVIGNVGESMKSDEVKKSIEDGAKPDALFNSLKDEAAPLIQQAIVQYNEACQGTDIILSSALTLHIAHYLSEEIKVPLIFCSVNPAGPTKDFPHILSDFISGPKFVQRTYNMATHKLATEIIWRMLRTELSKTWNKVMPERSFPHLDPLDKAFKKNPPLILYAYSPSILPKPKDWSIVQFVTGYWSLPPNNKYAPPQDLVDFVEKGEPPVYVGFGSLSNPTDQIITTIVAPALKSLKQRAVILNDGSDLSALKGDSDFYIIDSADFNWLFPKMKAIVHHGGAGTTGLGAWAGKPNLIVTFIPDQRFWARQLFEIGVTPKPIAKTELTRELFHERLAEALNSTSFSEKSIELSNNIKKEDGVKTAVELINQYINYKLG